MASRSIGSGSSFFPGPPEPAMEPAWLWSLVSSPLSTGGSSPASSPDSCGGFSPPEGPRWRPGGRGKAGGGARARLAHGQRQSASQREKLRMRHLAQALHALRRYLPGAGGQAGQNLTKIETLRLAIRYIAHLSELLGLSEEELARRSGAAARARPCCPLCPPGLGCCQAPFPQPGPTCAPVAPGSAAPWTLRSASAATSGAASGNPGQEWATAGTGAEHLGPPAAEWPPSGDLLPQSLPDELLSFLEGFVPLALQDFLSPAHPLPALLPPGLEARKECP